MKHTKIVDSVFNGEERSLAIVGLDWLTADPIPELQLQVSQQGSDAFVDLSLEEVEDLVNHLNSFLTMWPRKERPVSNPVETQKL